ncbi:amidohydrolase [Hyunsoonleella sp. SJ7]|uniref:Omega-amidase YafV n=1 Tax=Hyunsoonleella aquatilis TaxID=2762758 RepID=A0A923H7E5_9FLAO|nr:amidohydrolase [Hyunsoonleella aquatilis]MBC3756948.1 amidohydrolase [Hyunsoonleella aquatilis]
MQEELKIALLQSDLVWENPEENRINFTNKIEEIQEGVDVIVFPEMFTTGFTMHAENVAENMDGDTVKWMQHFAKSKGSAIVGSIVVSDNDKFYNRLLFVEPSGKISYYNKRHTFTLVGEDKVYAAGTEKVIIDYKGWKICPMICYDLRFPVWSRNVEDYDILLYVANWPIPRIDAWDTLLKARAIENMCYSIGVNRVGADGENINYNGNSSAYNVLGQKLTSIPLGKEHTEIITLQKKHINRYRNRLKFLDDRDSFSLK